jgi:hypothetical protein
MSALPSITVAGVTVEHNTQPWRVAKNRHPNSDNTDWGWIEGAPGNVCWSDNGRFDRVAAGEAVKIHNDWLEQQKPLLVKLIEATERNRKLAKRFGEASAAFEKAKAELEASDREVIRLSLQAEPEPAATLAKGEGKV